MRILILILSIVGLLQARDGFEFWVGNSTMAHAYFDIFNGIAAVMANETYLNLLKLVFTLGAFFIFVLGVFKVLQGGDAKGGMTDFAKYLIAGTMLLMLVLPDPAGDDATTAELLVQAKPAPESYCSLASEPNPANFSVSLPKPLAWFFASVNTIGYEMTNLATVTFSNVSLGTSINDSLQSMSVNGFGKGLEGAQALSKARLSYISNDYKGEFVDPESPTFGRVSHGAILNVGLSLFFKECITYVSSVNENLGSELQYAFSNTGNFLRTLDDIYNLNQLNVYENSYDDSPLIQTSDLNGVEPDLSAMLISYKNESGSENTGTCKDFYNELVKPTLVTNLTSDDTLCHSTLKQAINAGTLYLTTGNSTNNSAPVAKQIVLQAEMANFYRAEKSKSALIGQISAASGASQAEFITNSVGSGAYMAKMLPYLQMGIRAVLYAFFPFVFLVILLPGGFSVAKSYGQSMIWVELWSPVAAILNYFLGYFQIDRIAENGNNINMENMTTVLSDANMLASVGGYLYASVPALTYLILKGSAQMLGSITGGMAAGFAKNMDTDKINRDLSQVSEYNAYKANGGKADSLSKYQTLINEAEGLKAGTHMGTIDSMPGGVKGVSKGVGLAMAAADMKQAAEGREFGTDKQGYTDTYDKDAKKKMRTEKKQYESLTEDDIERISTANAGDLNRKDFATRQFMEYEAKKRGIDLSTAEGRKQMAEIAGGADSAKQIREFSKLQAGTKQYLMQHGYSKDQVDKMQRNGTLMTEGTKIAANEMGQTDGTSEANMESLKQAVNKQVYGENVSVNSAEDMKKILQADGKEGVTVSKNEKTGAFIAVDKEGNVYRAEKGKSFMRVDHSHAGKGEKSEDLMKDAQSYESSKGRIDQKWSEIYQTKGNLKQATHAAVAEEKIKNKTGDWKYNHTQEISNAQKQDLADQIATNDARYDQTKKGIDMAIKANAGDEETVKTLQGLKAELDGAGGNTAKRREALANVAAYSKGLDLMTQTTDQTKKVDNVKQRTEAGQTNQKLNRQEVLDKAKTLSSQNELIKQTQEVEELIVAGNAETYNTTDSKGKVVQHTETVGDRRTQRSIEKMLMKSQGVSEADLTDSQRAKLSSTARDIRRDMEQGGNSNASIRQALKEKLNISDEDFQSINDQSTQEIIAEIEVGNQTVSMASEHQLNQSLGGTAQAIDTKAMNAEISTEKERIQNQFVKDHVPGVSSNKDVAGIKAGADGFSQVVRTATNLKKALKGTVSGVKGTVKGGKYVAGQAGRAKNYAGKASDYVAAKIPDKATNLINNAGSIFH